MQYIWSIFPCTEGLRIFPVVIIFLPFLCGTSRESRLSRAAAAAVSPGGGSIALHLIRAAAPGSCTSPGLLADSIHTNHTREPCFCRVFFISKHVKGFFCKARVCFGVGFLVFTTSELDFCFIFVIL